MPVIQTSIPLAINLGSKWQKNIFRPGKTMLLQKTLPQVQRERKLPGWERVGQRAADLTPEKLTFT